MLMHKKIAFGQNCFGNANYTYPFPQIVAPMRGRIVRARKMPLFHNTRRKQKIYCNCFLGQLSELHRSQPDRKAKIIWQIHERLLTHWTYPVSSQFADSPSEWIPTRPAALVANTASLTAEKSWVTKKSLLLQSSPAWSKDCKESWREGTLRRITSLMF